MKHTNTAAMAATKRAHVMALSGLITAWLALSVLSGCDSPAPSHAETKSAPEIPMLVHQADGHELMVIANPQAEEGSIGTVRQAPLPGVLEATGQVTFDDRLVSTIISRVTGRIEEVRTSRWDIGSARRAGDVAV